MPFPRPDRQLTDREVALWAAYEATSEHGYNSNAARVAVNAALAALADLGWDVPR